MADYWKELLENYEARVRLVEEVDKEIKKVTNELRNYLVDQSNVGMISVGLSRKGGIAEPLWNIEISDFYETITLEDVKINRVTSDGIGGHYYDENASIQDAVRRAIAKKFTFK